MHGIHETNSFDKKVNNTSNNLSKEDTKAQLKKFDEAANCILLAKDPEKPNVVNVKPEVNMQNANVLIDKIKDFINGLRQGGQKVDTEIEKNANDIIEKVTEAVESLEKEKTLDSVNKKNLTK